MPPVKVMTITGLSLQPHNADPTQATASLPEGDPPNGPQGESYIKCHQSFNAPSLNSNLGDLMFNLKKKGQHNRQQG